MLFFPENILENKMLYNWLLLPSTHEAMTSSKRKINLPLWPIHDLQQRSLRWKEKVPDFLLYNCSQLCFAPL
jgi:hypothetical protein